jgi:hypothetical protein
MCEEIQRMRLSGSGKSVVVKSISTCDTIVGGLRRASGDIGVVTGSVSATCMDNQESTCVTCVHRGTAGTCWLAWSLASV